MSSLEPDWSHHSVERHKLTAATSHRIGFIGLSYDLAKTSLRFVAITLAAFILCVAWDASNHFASAQFHRAAPVAPGRPPLAAPAGATAESAPLAAPAGNAALAGPQAEIQEAFTPVGLFVRADI